MNKEPKKTIRFAEFELDANKRRLLREGEPLALNAKAFDVLVFLAENAGRVVLKEEILNAVWENQFVEEANLAVQISALRKALGEDKDAPRLLVTIPGKGYEFIADIQNGDEDVGIESRTTGRVVIDEKIGKIEETQIADAEQFTKRKPQNRRAVFALAGLALLITVGLVGFRYFNDAPKTPINSLAVLPFVNQNNDANTEYLSDGLAESVIYSLSQIPELRVMSRNSSFRYKGKETDAKTIGSELNVQAVLTGRIVQFGDTLSVSVDLVSASDNSVIWGERFTRQMSDVEKLQTDIAQLTLQKLRLKLSGADEQRFKKPQTENSEAYQLYLMGRYHLNRLTDDGFLKGREYFQRAIDKDPNYALAYAGLADSYNRLSGWNALSPKDGFPKARVAATKALELDDELAEAHTAMGTVKHFYDWDWQGAERDFRRAIEINPGNADAHQIYSFYLSAMGRFDEALAEIKHAQELDPLSLEKITGSGDILRYQRQYDQAIEKYQKALEMEPNSGFAHWAIGNAYVNKGMYKEAIAEYQKAIPLSGDSPDEPASLGYVYALSGRRQEALQIIDDLKQQSKRSYISPTLIAIVYTGLGEKEQAFEWLDKAYNGQDSNLVYLKVDPMFDNLRSDPRYADLLRRVGLP
jgi:TolB-like protein/DNA-binding winged helix-turn-helix (wHTH) protein/Flp pilus assembly protein TadD